MREAKLEKRFGLLGATMIGVGAIVETTLSVTIGTSVLHLLAGILEADILAMAITLVIYFDMLQARSLIALPLVHLPLCILVLFSLRFICIASGSFLITQTRRRS